LELLDLFGAQLQGFLHGLYWRAILSITPIAARGAATRKLRGKANTKKQYGNDVFDQSHFLFFLRFHVRTMGVHSLEHAREEFVYTRL